MWAIEFAGKGLVREHMLVPVEGSPAGKAFTTGEPALFERADLAALDSEVGHALLAEGIQSMCSVPLGYATHRLAAPCRSGLTACLDTYVSTQIELDTTRDPC